MKNLNIDSIENNDQIMSFDALGEFIDDEGNFTNQEDFDWWGSLADALGFIAENTERTYKGGREVIMFDYEKWYVSELQDYINIAAEIKEKKTNTDNININMEQIKGLLSDETVSIYAIAKDIGVSRSTLNLYRTGQSKLENMSIKLAKKLQQYINKINNL